MIPTRMIGTRKIFCARCWPLACHAMSLIQLRHCNGRSVAGNKLSFCISLIAAGLLLLVRQYEVALSLAGSPGSAVNRYLVPPHNSGQLPVVLAVRPVGCLPLAVESGECEVLRIRRSYSGTQRHTRFGRSYSLEWA